MVFVNYIVAMKDPTEPRTFDPKTILLSTTLQNLNATEIFFCSDTIFLLNLSSVKYKNCW